VSRVNVERMRTAPLSEPEVLSEISALPDLTDSDYRYGCVLTTRTAGERSAEEWAREMFEGAPRLVRQSIVLGWRFGLGLRLGPIGRPSHVLGWEIARQSTGDALLRVSSPLLDARLVVKTRTDTVVHLTLVRYRSRVTRAWWAIAAPVHECVIPYLLRSAARRGESQALASSLPTG
jgi:hypothetical protein